jgi:hypothetical protein
VIGVRVDDQLGVGQVLLQNVGVVCRDNYVVTALNDQGGLPDALEVVELVLRDVVANGVDFMRVGSWEALDYSSGACFALLSIRTTASARRSFRR